MRGRAALRLTVVLAAVACLRAAPCAAQVGVSLDAAASLVKYDGYLASGAASLAPAVSWRSDASSLGARGSLLVFESGNTSIAGLVTAATFSPSLGPVRVEASGEAGASAYAGFARFAHVLVETRVHLLREGWGLWAGPVGGRLSRGSGGSWASGASAGWWTRALFGGLGVSWSAVRVGDTSYADVEGRLRWQRGRLDVEGSLGARLGHRGGGHGVYGDLSASVRLRDDLALVVAGGTYPSDPVRGSIPGRFATAGVRFSPPSAARATAVRTFDAPEPPPVGLALPDARRADVSVERLDGLAILVVRVSGVQRVEVSGDFTDWLPVPLTRSGEGRFRYAVSLPEGVQRFNLRLDGGPWGVPRGAGSLADDFGGRVGILVVP